MKNRKRSSKDISVGNAEKDATKPETNAESRGKDESLAPSTSKYFKVSTDEAIKPEKSTKTAEKDIKCEKESAKISTNQAIKPKKLKKNAEKDNKSNEESAKASVANQKGNESKVTKKTRLALDFYDRPCEDLAKALLGQTLVRVLESGECLKAKIVETEAYLGREDKAAHSFGGKKTKRNAAMFMDPGTAYVYHIYGMYTCMNISSRGEGAAVLLRAVEPLEGTTTMKKQRSLKKSDTSKPLKDKEIGSGPSKLTQAISVDKISVDQKDLCTADHIWLERGVSVSSNQIVSCKRIGIAYAGDWVDKKLRFYVLGNEHVSVRDKAAEKELLEQNKLSNSY